jgi:hypothetical protein
MEEKKKKYFNWLRRENRGKPPGVLTFQNKAGFGSQ